MRGIMRIKKYVAKSVREALIQIKEEFGEEAVILKTRKLPKKVFSIGDQNDIEVTAAIDESSSDVKPLPMPPLQVANKDGVTGVYRRQRPRTSCIVDMDKPDSPEVKPWYPPSGETSHVKLCTTTPDSSKEGLQIFELKENLNELRELVKTALVNGNASASVEFSGACAVLYKKLIDSEVNAELAENLVKSINSSGTALSDVQVEKKFISVMNTGFPVSGPLKLKKSGPLIVAFVGPTGAGNTTPLAKLAAYCAVHKSKSVSIITADTYRIAAIEQIRIFADIVKVGLQVIFSPEEIPVALQECVNDDIVFIDTAGRSQRNTAHMEELKNLMNGLQPDEIHLVLGATTKYSDLKDIIERYQTIKVNRLLFTKLDETLKIGNIFNIVNDSHIPLSYLTFGQSVPDDIELAQGGRFVHRLLECVA